MRRSFIEQEERGQPCDGRNELCAQLVAAVTGLAPLLLLDEAAAHFDACRRDALFELSKSLGGQIWLTGTDAAAFAAIKNEALMLTVTPAAVTPARQA